MPSSALAPTRVGVVIGTSTSGVGEARNGVARLCLDGGAAGSDFTMASKSWVHRPRVLATDAWRHRAGLCPFQRLRVERQGAGQCGSADSHERLRRGDRRRRRYFVPLSPWPASRRLNRSATTRCNPLSRNRNGINIGEGAALFLVSREPATVRLRGWGESSDGYHMSAPDPAGVGARLAMERALARAAVDRRRRSSMSICMAPRRCKTMPWKRELIHARVRRPGVR